MKLRKWWNKITKRNVRTVKHLFDGDKLEYRHFTGDRQFVQSFEVGDTFTIRELGTVDDGAFKGSRAEILLKRKATDEYLIAVKLANPEDEDECDCEEPIDWGELENL
jgi:hypothetical protein